MFRLVVQYWIIWKMELRRLIPQPPMIVGELVRMNAVSTICMQLAKLLPNLKTRYDTNRDDAMSAFWNQRQTELETLAATVDTASSYAAPLKPAYLAIAALYSIAIMHAFHPAPSVLLESVAVVPLTFHEISYAIRDGYIGNLIGHWFRNGGLLISGSVEGIDDDAARLLSTLSSSATSISTPSFVLSPQEVFWSIRDGYVDDTFFTSTSMSSVPPSLQSSMDMDSISSSMRDSVIPPFTPQEVWWAVQGGYFPDLITHWFRNGELL